MARIYQRKFLDDGITPNPKYKLDTRKSDRHLDKSDRHTTNENRHSSRARKRFIALDGEGINTEKIIGYSKTKSGRNIPIYEHLYVLLVASRGEHIMNENGLSTIECFDFLLNLAEKYTDAIFVCFGASYDVNKMLKDLPFEVIRKVYESEDNGLTASPVYYQGINGSVYTMTYRPRRSFTLSRLTGKAQEYTLNIVTDEGGIKSTEYKRKPNTSLTLWDAAGFFPGRFVDVLGSSDIGYFHEYLHEENGHEIIEWPDGLRIDLTLMKEMKNRRRSFTREQLEEIAPYCHDEVKALQRLMERLKELLDEAEVLPFQSRWYGAGACANTLLQRYHVKESMKEYMPGASAKELKDVQLHGYSGGRFELGKWGVHIGKVWNYDLRSAFPSIMVDLPRLTDGMWRYVPRAPSRPYSIVHVRWQLAGSTFYPFFFRNDLGSIYFPDGNEKDGGLEGWYWKPEVDAALKALAEGKLKGNIKVIESWEFQPYTDTKPFAFIRDIYDKRRKWESEGNPAHKVLKFTINYIYGKLIQSLGWLLDEDGNIRKPTYHNVGYAGYITASIRAKIFEAMMQAPDQIINVVSDGLYSRVPLDLPIGDDMGQWKVHEGDGIIMISPGIFWGLVKLGHEPTEQERQEEYFESKYLYYDGEWYRASPHFQGFDRGKLKPSDVVNWWKSKSSGTMKAQSTRFVTMASATLDEELWKCWGSWRQIEMELSTSPQGKRYQVEPSIYKNMPDKRLEDTIASSVWVMNSPMSEKFKRSWESDDDYGLIDGVDKDIYIAEHSESDL